MATPATHSTTIASSVTLFWDTPNVALSSALVGKLIEAGASASFHAAKRPTTLYDDAALADDTNTLLKAIDRTQDPVTLDFFADELQLLIDERVALDARLDRPHPVYA
ncbi:hypothetical protein [Streptomyces venezuelae]|uniref:hypothetical protein n=1 Tax=Streptomyces venezuelae TaxID=54571 RepID=UPI003448225F